MSNRLDPDETPKYRRFIRIQSICTRLSQHRH